MKEYAKDFYRSTAWKKLRKYIFQRDFGLCCRCGRPGTIVHHKKYITPENINNPAITLNADNLELLCEACHNQEHKRNSSVADNCQFDADGNLIIKNIFR